jgi:hypothetical protein
MSSMHGDVQVTCRQAVQFVSEFVCFVYNSTFSCLCFWTVVLFCVQQHVQLSVLLECGFVY